MLRFFIPFPPLWFRSTFALPPYQSRCKVDAKSVEKGRIIEFGSEEEGSYYGLIFVIILENPLIFVYNTIIVCSRTLLFIIK